jgi:hypothetical protein
MPLQGAANVTREKTANRRRASRNSDSLPSRRLEVELLHRLSPTLQAAVIGGALTLAQAWELEDAWLMARPGMAAALPERLWPLAQRLDLYLWPSFHPCH